MSQSNLWVKFFFIIGVFFIALRLDGSITWSWWWILAPVWIPLGSLILYWLFISLFVKDIK